MKLTDIQISQECLSEIELHCFSELLMEVGGFLVGRVDDEITEIEGFIPSLKAVQGDTHLTFGHEAWDEAFSLLEKKYPGRSIVGWYHTHPDFGVFLSEYDKFIQVNFFSQPGYLALVVDPIRGKMGWFETVDGKVVEHAQSDTRNRPVVTTKEEVLVARTLERNQSRNRLVIPASVLVVALISLLVTNTITRNRTEEAAAENLRKAKETSLAEITELQGRISDLEAELDSVEVTEDGLVYTYLYTVRNGDSLWRIAEIFFGDGQMYRDILKWNENRDVSNLKTGSKVIIKLTQKEKA